MFTAKTQEKFAMVAKSSLEEIAEAVAVLMELSQDEPTLWLKFTLWLKNFRPTII
ncbi:hypothetical protein FACS189460_2830 [Deltaproteobacteria bacterium]|nr:hypothetical protein FACS189460_2830 [Deltaproteobacteria bacterium]